MGTGPKVRAFTVDLFTQQKWVLLIRDRSEDEWRTFGNKISGRPYIYSDLDKATYALKHLQATRYMHGNAKLVKAETLNDD